MMRSQTSLDYTIKQPKKKNLSLKPDLSYKIPLFYGLRWAKNKRIFFGFLRQTYLRRRITFSLISVIKESIDYKIANHLHLAEILKAEIAQSGDTERLSLNCRPVLFSFNRCFYHLCFLLPLSAVYCSAKVVAIIPAASGERWDYNRAALTKEGHSPSGPMAALNLQYTTFVSMTASQNKKTHMMVTYCCHLVLNLFLGIGVCFAFVTLMPNLLLFLSLSFGGLSVDCFRKVNQIIRILTWKKSSSRRL
ncbi:hypothetical protein CHARACLAT_000729 [Characodon lateralis]|uniref:Uncharacterized protein n=1 Tax=Characodon lateralis TaxID=208331 RepID=A0ABU7EZ71_9TELE|nr:hypothetical protein [Characodon lateralis]